MIIYAHVTPTLRQQAAEPMDVMFRGAVS